MKSGLLLFTVTLWLIGLPVAAHHSAAAFDPNLDVDVTGQVNRLEWTSPHARLYVDQTLEDGTMVTWNFELPSPVGLMRKGWRRDDIAPGDAITVTGFRAKEYPTIAIAETVRDGQGRQLFSNR